jgi:hypothetical protein
MVFFFEQHYKYIIIFHFILAAMFFSACFVTVMHFRLNLFKNKAFCLLLFIKMGMKQRKDY